MASPSVDATLKAYSSRPTQYQRQHTPDQKPALNVLLGPPVFGFQDSCRGFFWSWRVRDLDNDGQPEIQIGPRTADDDIAPVATYRWSAEKRQYLGPSGSPEQGFLTYSVEDDKNLDKRFADYWRSHQDQRTGHRRSRCKTVGGD